MTKLVDNSGMLLENEISLAQLRRAKVSDEIVVMTTEGETAWFQVIARKGTRGQEGVTMTLRDLSNGHEHTETYGKTLPAGIARVRRVSAGFNQRTLDKLPGASTEVSEPAPVAEKVEQPEGEFENILDVPMEPLAVVNEAPSETIEASEPVAAEG